MKRIMFLLLAVMSASVVLGQKRVAMLEPVEQGGTVSQIQKAIVLGALEKAITSIDGYNAFTRTDIDAINFEQEFQRSGKVDDEQKKKLGIMSGVDYICISVLTPDKESGDLYIKCSLIEMESGLLDNSDNELMKMSPNSEINEGCKRLAVRLLGGKSGGNRRGGTSASGNQRPNTQTHPAEPEMVFVQGGTFWMGCSSEQGGDCDSDERPLHSVTLSDYYIGKYEVTQAQWEMLMGNNPSNFKGGNLPVENVSWNDAQMFIERLNAATGKQYRLPTEAEWEYAARGGNKGNGNKYAGSNFVENVAWMTNNSGNSTHQAGTKLANELGIYDMSGNVWEWCYDWFGTYPASAQNNPVGASSGSYRVYRGGGWGSGASGCRVADRNFNSPGYRTYNLGFRLACSSE